jgi:hypothetical protein
MLRIEPRLAFINGVLLANRVLIFCFQLLAVYVLLVHNCGECRIGNPEEIIVYGFPVSVFAILAFCRKFLFVKILLVLLIFTKLDFQNLF